MAELQFNEILSPDLVENDLNNDQKASFTSLKELWQKRAKIVAKLVKFETAIIQFKEGEIDIHTFHAKISMLERILDTFIENQQAIYDNPVVAEDEEEDNEILFKARYQKARCEALELVEDASEDKPKKTSSSSQIKLPKQKIPEFRGDLTDWRKFKDTFVALIHSNEDVPDVQKFHYLMSALQNNSDSVIKEIPISAENYEIAWKVLVERYDNQNAIIDAHLDKIFALKPIAKDNYSELRNLVDVLQSNIRALSAMKIPIDQWSAILVYVVKQRLDIETRKQFQLKQNPSDLPDFEKLLSFLNQRCRVLETVQPVKLQKEPDTKSYGHYSKHRPKSVNVSVSESKCCKLCSDPHPLFYCPKFLRMNPKQRRDKVRDLKNCYKCLGPHTKDCNQKGACKICGDTKHNTLLHIDSDGDKEDFKGESSKAESKLEKFPLTSNSCIQLHVNRFRNRRKQILMGTAVILIEDSRGQWIPVKALLDAGSHANFITEKLVQALGLKKQKAFVPVSGINGAQSCNKHKTVASFRSRTSTYEEKTDFLVTSKISDQLLEEEIDISNWNIPEHLELADPSFFENSSIDILLGAEFFFDIIGTDKIQLGVDNITLTNSELGWIVAGRFFSTSRSHIPSFFIQAQNLPKFASADWMSGDIEYTQEDFNCELHFRQTFQRDETGRYIVRLPVKPEMSLGESRSIAFKRLMQLQKQFQNKPDLKKQYFAFMDEYFKLGHMVRATEQPKDPSRTYYIPHHPVIKPTSTTTKLRVVFNASSKTRNQKSLNDILMTGPNLQNDLRSILLRFMMFKYAFMADIEKHFRQVKVHPDDWDLLRILFWDETGEVIEILLTTVTYGTICAPYQAIRVLVQAAIDEGTEYPLAVKALSDFYMDNEMSGADSIEELIEIQCQINQVLAKAGMKLRKFAANDERLLSHIPIEDRDILGTISNHENSVSALGLVWNPASDKFSFNVPDIETQAVWTKRKILTQLRKIFDPLGWIGPVTVLGDLIIQKSWTEGFGWDDTLPPQLSRPWVELHQQFASLRSIQKDRFLAPYKEDIQLHGFADASMKAYGACVYIRSESPEGQVTVQLVDSASRLAPQPNKKRKKPVTLPKLELNAALLLSRLVKKTAESSQLTFDSRHLWSDSQITLHWIHGDPDKLVPYVGKRVKEIQKLQPSYRWHHVESKQNPADIISRGMLPEQLLQSSLWWNGPQFLQDFNNEVLISDFSKQVDVQQFDCFMASTPYIRHVRNQIKFQNYSNYNRIVRAAAYVLRFVRMCRTKTKIKGPFSCEDIEEAERFVVKQIQLDSFQSEYYALSNGKPINRNSQLLTFNPMMKDGVIVVGGRLHNSLLPETEKHPMIIPSHHIATPLLIKHIHQKTMHGGVQLTLSTLRQKYWILQGRSVVKKVIRNCVTCFKVHPRSVEQIMGILPAERVQPNRPFAVCGLDYCGYFHVLLVNKRSRAFKKVWVCVFVCFATKAAHLEPVTDLTTEAFRSCLSRFQARRGKCTILNSDNQSTFHGAKNQMDAEIRKFLSDPTINDEIKSLCANDGINWKFIPPKCPHVGGIWESCVKSFKHHFKRIVGEAHLTLENFFTLVYKIESMLNSRPMIQLTEDHEDLVLTPGHILIGEALNTPAETDVSSVPDNRLKQHVRRQKIEQLFWKAWSKDYLNTLQQRNKWKTESPPVKEGDVCLIVEDNLPSLKWLLGVVVKMVPGPDGKIRMVDIRLQDKKITRRSIHRIRPLPTNEN